MDEARNLKMENSALNNSMASTPWDAIEKKAVLEHPTVFRTTQPVSDLVKKAQIETSKRRQPKRSKAKLP
jgi:hypothetical protein